MLPDPPPSRPSGGLHSRLEPKPTPAKRPTRPTIFLLLTLVILLLLLVILLPLHLCTSPLHSIGTSNTPTTKLTISFNPLSMLLSEQMKHRFLLNVPEKLFISVFRLQTQSYALSYLKRRHNNESMNWADANHEDEDDEVAGSRWR